MRMLMAFECNSQMNIIPKTENGLSNTATGLTHTHTERQTEAHKLYGYGHGCTTTNMNRCRSFDARIHIFYIGQRTFDAAC